jgi:hypothetical protein
MTREFPMSCGCDSLECQLLVPIPTDEAARIIGLRLFVISRDCKHGPEETDELVEARESYLIFREGSHEA